MSDSNTPQEKVIVRRQRHRTKAYPISIRRQVLRAISDGVSFRDIALQTSLSLGTVQNWVKDSEVTTKSRLTEEELDAKIEAWRQRALAKGVEFMDENDPKNVIRQAEKERAKFGPNPESKAKALLAFQGLGDPDEYQNVVKAHMNRMISEMHRATSPEDQINAAMGGMLLVQLQQVLVAPPPVITVADFERLFKMIRTTFGMDKADGSKSEGADLRILNAKIPGRGKIQEAQVVKGEPSDEDAT